MKFKLRAYAPGSEGCYAVVDIDAKLASRIIGRMRLFESVKAGDPCLKAIKYWPDKARWYRGTTSREVEMLTGEDSPPERGRAMCVDYAEMVVAGAAVWWSCLLHGAEGRLITAGLSREDLSPLVESKNP